jgi:hypothetical protein
VVALREIAEDFVKPSILDETPEDDFVEELRALPDSAEAAMPAMPAMPGPAES